jgi:hypothetical protein
MAAKKPVISPARLESIVAVQQSAVAKTSAVLRMPAALVAVMTASFMLMLGAAAHAATITVNSLADAGAPGICVLRDAITAANTKTATNGCIAGTGRDTIKFKVTGTITLASKLPEVTDGNLTINGPASPAITIDGGGAVPVMQVASGPTLDLKNLAIAHGSNVTSSTAAGGISNEGTLTLTNSTISGNTALNFDTSGIGGISNKGTLTLTNSTISGNTTLGPNGGIGGISNEGMLTITNSTISDNTTELGTGGISSSGRLTVTNSTISGNTTLDFGTGGISSSGRLTVTNSTISGNGSDFGSGSGGISNEGTLTITNSIISSNFGVDTGGIGNSLGTLTVINSTFSSNVSVFGPGGIGNSLGTLTVINSTFSGNETGTESNSGGGIDNSGRLTVTNSTFSGNIANSGGGILNLGTALATVINSTFSGNNNGGGAGAGISNGSTRALTVKSTILAASNGSNCSGKIIDAGYNISDDFSCGFAKTGSANNGGNVNPLLSTAGLANNGGPTQTIALGVGSPAIDAIPLAQCTDLASPPNPIITDQRLFPRPDPGGANCDIGAFDVQDFPFIPFSAFGGGLRIDPDAGIFVLGGRFVLGTGGTIDPASQPVAFAVGNDAVRLPAGSFVPDSVGYAYQKTVNGISRYIHIKFTSAPGIYQLVALRKGGTLTTTTSPVPVTLTIGNDSGSTQMNATFN